MVYTPGWRFPLVAQPKARPHRLVKQQADAGRDTIDREEKAKVKARSGGRCEVFIVCDVPVGRRVIHVPFRCALHASENHHLIGGIGRRNRGKSILAAHRLHVCERCHRDITGNVLRPVDGTKKELAATVRYTRVTR